MLFNGTILLLFSSVCLHHLAFYKMFEHTLHQLDQPRNKRNDKKLLCELIRFHNTVKALVCFSSLFLSLWNFQQIHFFFDQINPSFNSNTLKKKNNHLKSFWYSLSWEISKALWALTFTLFQLVFGNIKHLQPIRCG